MYPHLSLRDVWGAYAIRPYMYPAKFAGVRRRPYAIRPYNRVSGKTSLPRQGPSADAPSLTAEETADVTQAEDEAADRNRRAAKQ